MINDTLTHEIINRAKISLNHLLDNISILHDRRIAPGVAPCRDWLTVTHVDLNPNDPGARDIE